MYTTGMLMYVQEQRQARMALEQAARDSRTLLCGVRLSTNASVGRGDSRDSARDSRNDRWDKNKDKGRGERRDDSSMKVDPETGKTEEELRAIKVGIASLG